MNKKIIFTEKYRSQMSSFQWIVTTIGLSIMFYAIISFTYKLVKGEPLWPNLKRKIQILFDGFWGIG
jgi:hypothetical protein